MLDVLYPRMYLGTSEPVLQGIIQKYGGLHSADPGVEPSGGFADAEDRLSLDSSNPRDLSHSFERYPLLLGFLPRWAK